MSFGKNPHVARAEAAEEKARNAGDVSARSLAWREAGNFWERAAERERDTKRQATYRTSAAEARARADESEEGGAAPAGASTTGGPTAWN